MGSPFQRQRWAVVVRLSDGRVSVVDQFLVRLSKMRARVGAWAKVVDSYRAAHGGQLVMVTLTYRGADDYRPGHIGSYLLLLRNYLQSGLIGWAWVSELQRRGAVHYHLVALIEDGARIPKPDDSGMWPHGMSRVERAKTAFYLLTYTGKERQKDLGRYPKGCRLYGVSVRGLGASLRAAYRMMSGVGRTGAAEGEWSYVGSAIVQGYLNNVLVPEAEFQARIWGGQKAAV